jgi:hypothetical protein
VPVVSAIHRFGTAWASLVEGEQEDDDTLLRRERSSFRQDVGRKEPQSLQ